MRKSLMIFLFSLFLLGCREVKTTDPQKAYTCWAGEKPPGDMQVINGQYWRSAHATREYIVYLHIKPTTEWWNAYTGKNHLSPDSSHWIHPDDAPAWFTPPVTAIQYSNTDDADQGSRYFRDTLSGECFIYEIQL